MYTSFANKLLTHLSYSRPQLWTEIEQAWQKDEERPNSKSVFLQDVGQDWQAWRSAIILPLHLDRLEWGLFAVIDPIKTIPLFHGGPFEPWQRLYYGNKQTPTFEDIIASPGTDVQTRDKFASILNSSKPINLIGIIKNDQIYIIDCMHRCVAIALAASRGQSIINNVSISLAVSDLTRIPTI